MTDTNTRHILGWFARANTDNPAYRVQALAALYIGDGLREIATAIANHRPLLPTQDEIAHRLALVKQVAEQVTEQLLDEAACGMSEAERAETAGECWSCRHWIRSITTGGQLGYCDLATSPTNTAGVTGKCTGFANEQLERT